MAIRIATRSTLPSVFRSSSSTIRSMFLAIACAAIAGLAGDALFAQPLATPDETTRSAAATPATLQAFFDRVVPAQLQEHKIAGATVSVVQDGRIVFEQGYGLADAAKNLPVDPRRTLFRAGSVSKLFVWTALMQLYEQGKIDLDADVNRYANVVPPTFQRPIRVRDLMSHTPGFEDRMINLFIDDPARLKNLEQVIKVDPPARIRPPGTVISYSNYGASLGGYIVEQVSGMSFTQYVETHILEPLGMRHTTFVQPVPESMRDALSQGYVYEGSPTADEVDAAAFAPQVFEIVQGAAAGGISTTAHDMALFLLAHLGAGSINAPPPGRNGRILQPATVRLMHSTHFRPAPNANGFAHGFMELDSHGLRIIGHGGDTIWFHTVAAILPEKNLGFFFSTNTADGPLAVATIKEKFLDTFFPGPTGAELQKRPERGETERRSTTRRPLDDYIGRFAANRRSEREPTKIISLFSAIDLRRNEAGDGLAILDFFSGDYLDCVPLGENLFQERDGQRQFVFLENNAGEIYGLIDNNLAVMTFVRPPWYEWSFLHFGIAALAALLFGVGLFVRPSGVFAFIPRGYRQALDADARRAGYLASLLVLTYLGFLGVMLILNPGYEIIFSTPARWPFYLPFAAFICNLAALAYLLPAWSRRYWSRSVRIYYTVLVVGLLPFFWFLYYWNLVA